MGEARGRVLKKTGMGWPAIVLLGFRFRMSGQRDVFQYPPKRHLRSLHTAVSDTACSTGEESTG